MTKLIWNASHLSSIILVYWFLPFGTYLSCNPNIWMMPFSDPCLICLQNLTPIHYSLWKVCFCPPFPSPYILLIWRGLGLCWMTFVSSRMMSSYDHIFTHVPMLKLYSSKLVVTYLTKNSRWNDKYLKFRLLGLVLGIRMTVYLIALMESESSHWSEHIRLTFW